MVMPSPHVINYQCQPIVHNEVFLDKDYILLYLYSIDSQSKMKLQNQTSLSRAIVIQDHIYICLQSQSDTKSCIKTFSQKHDL
jgi:hypothetical protein